MAKKLSKSENITALLDKGLTPKEIATKLGCTTQSVYQIRHKNKKWNHVSVVTPVPVPENKITTLGALIENAQSKIKDHATKLYISPEALDMVNNPPHYKRNGIEVIDVIEAFDLNYRLGNVVKYVLRHDNKGGVEDLKKARWYLDREISKYEG